MKIDKIEIAIAARGCLDYEIDEETEAYLDAYADAVAEAVAEAFPDAKVECELDWSAPASSVTIESQEYDAIEVDGIRKTQRGISPIEDLEREVEATREMHGVDETVREILQYIWGNPDKWWHRKNAA